jgi:hypothetical protein
VLVLGADQAQAHAWLEHPLLAAQLNLAGGEIAIIRPDLYCAGCGPARPMVQALFDALAQPATATTPHDH